MRYGVDITNFGEYADPRNVIRLAQMAETAGWEGLFVWDHLGFVWGVPSGDPWVVLAAVAASTARLKIGTSVTPLPRRRPQVLAHTLATLDILSNGRVVFGAGLGGVPAEYTAFGEPDDPMRLAAMLDEGLEVLSRLWSGERVMHHGPHYIAEGVTLAPLPIQRPRIPVWIGGESAPALRRAARWDGWIPGGVDEHGRITKSPEQLAAQVAIIRQQRTSAAPLEVAILGQSAPTERALARAYEEAGATWWLEMLHGLRGSFDEMLSRTAAGPPV